MYKRFLTVALLIPLAGCATKRDLQDLQNEVAAMRTSQDRALADLQRQNEAIMNALENQGFQLRGEFSNQILQLERQQVQILELLGQSQQEIAQLRGSLRTREEALQRSQADMPVLTAADSADAREMFDAAEGALQRRALSTARLAFQDFIANFPQHDRAPEARLYLGNILHEEGDAEGALEAYSRILELHPDAPEAATALFQAALVERGRGNAQEARSLFNQLTAAYPSSPEAAVARSELERM